MSPVNTRDASEIERIAGFARSANDGLIVTEARQPVHRDVIITLAARHRLPAVYSRYKRFVSAGGLLSYGARSRRPVPASCRLRRSHPQGRAAGRPARAGADQVRVRCSTSRPPRRSASTVPPTLLARADEVIE